MLQMQMHCSKLSADSYSADHSVLHTGLIKRSKRSPPQVLKMLAGGICAAADNKVHCFSLDLTAQQFTLKATLEVKQQGIADIRIRQDQRLFATAGWDGKIRVFHYKKQKALAVLQVSFVVSFCCARASDIISLSRLCTFHEAASVALSFTQTIHKEHVT